jgi:hypothetical protein
MSKKNSYCIVPIPTAGEPRQAGFGFQLRKLRVLWPSGPSIPVVYAPPFLGTVGCDELNTLPVMSTNDLL